MVGGGAGRPGRPAMFARQARTARSLADRRSRTAARAHGRLRLRPSQLPPARPASPAHTPARRAQPTAPSYEASAAPHMPLGNGGQPARAAPCALRAPASVEIPRYPPIHGAIDATSQRRHRRGKSRSRIPVGPNPGGSAPPRGPYGHADDTMTYTLFQMVLKEAETGRRGADGREMPRSAAVKCESVKRLGRGLSLQSY